MINLEHALTEPLYIYIYIFMVTFNILSQDLRALTNSGKLT